MSRRRRIAAIVGGSILGFLAIAIIAGIVLVQTDWFRNMVRTRIVSAVEDATGGRVEIASFAFDWHHLRAQVRGFVIHGLEPADAAPLLRASLVQVDLKLLAPFKGFVDIAYLLVDTPQANVIVYPDGHTNVPAPKVQATSSNKRAFETIVNLAIGRFDLRNGSFVFAHRQWQLNASGGNLSAQLGYNALNPSYTGELDISPLHLREGLNTAVDVDVKLPLTMEKDKISLANAQLTTTQSKIVISGSLDHLIAPHTAAHVNALIALDEVRRVAGLNIALDTVHGPRTLNADVTASMDENRIQVQAARLILGQTNLGAHGTLQDTNGAAGVQFQSTLALGELGRLLRAAARPEGTVTLAGNAALPANSDFRITASMEGRGLSFHQGDTRLAGVSLDSTVTADRRRIALDGLRLSALGGTFTGKVGLQEFAQLQLSGNLRDFDLQQVARAFMPKPPAYDGIVSGPVQASGNIKHASTLVASATLGITPGSRGTPVAGRLAANYDGRAGNVMVDHSYLTLPHTRIELSGSLGQQIQVRVVTRDFSDFNPIAAIPVTFNQSGSATVNATVSGSISAPQIAGQVVVSNFAVDSRSFTGLTAAVVASSSTASVSNAVLTKGTLQARFSGSIGLHDWDPEPYQPLHLDATIRNADLRDMLALAGQSDVNAAGVLAADAHIDGTVGSPSGSADLTVARGSIEGQPFDNLAAHAVLTQTAIDVPSLQLLAGPSRIDATARYDHPVNDLERGTLALHVASNQVQLAQFQNLVKQRPGLRGVLTLNADAAARIQPGPAGTELQIETLQANTTAHGLEMQGKALGDFTATADTAGRTVRYNVNSDFGGSSIKVSGESALDGNHQTTATAAIANLPVDRVLAIAGRTDLPVRGTLALNGKLSGTIEDPHANVSLTVTNAKAYDEPFDRLQATVNYDHSTIDLPQFRIDEGPSYVELTAAFTHPAGDIEDGQVRFHVRSNTIQAARIHAIQEREPGLDGTLQVAADGAATLHRNAAPLISTLDANISARGLTVNKKPVGDLTASAATSGNAVNFNLNSDFAGSSIRGTGRLSVGGDYPLAAQVAFSNVTYSGLSHLLQDTAQPFDASMEGRVEVSGPITNTAALRGALRLTKLEAHSIPPGKGRQPRVKFDMHNAGDVMVALDRSVISIQNFRVEGPYTNLTLTGSAGLTGAAPINVRANGNIKLDVLQSFNSNIFSSGAVTLNGAVTGTTAQPLIRGTLQLQNTSFNLLDLPQGISNASGTVQFNGTEAVLQNITGQSGGGKVTLAGSVGYGGPEMQFRVQVTASQVHIEYPATVTTQVTARLALNGTTSNSLLSGTVSVQDLLLHSHSDVGSILTSAATPPSGATPTGGLLGGMHFDVRIRTASDVQFRTTLTQNLQADANLTLRGTPDHPGMIGRITVTQGDVVFFGAKYSIDQGTIAFYDLQKIEPVLSVDLETTVQGVDVSLSVSGPIERLKLSYRSDPPLEFQQIVSLLATGAVPTTDPVLAAHTPAAPQQNFEQTGASTLLGQAVANPISGRLQRLFGVSKLSIDPQIVGNSNSPQATMTFQQQVTKDITFTYIQDVTRSNSQSIRVEWAISPQFSAVLQRDLYGDVNLDFFYKKRFH
jgi:autotransporter translocation and assembly factor TamB